MVYTLQIGASVVQAISLFIFRDFWYLFFYLITAFGWLLVFRVLDEFKINCLSCKDKLILLIIFFFQPYNINQIANFSNEALYIPFLIYFFFIFYDFCFKYRSFFILSCLGFFLVIGIFFRIHHVIFCLSIFLFAIKEKKLKIIKLLILCGMLQIIFFVFVSLNTNLENAFFEHIKAFSKIFSDYFNAKTFEINSSSQTSISFYLMESNFFNILYKLSIILSSPIFATKFISNKLIILLVNFTFIIFIIYGLFLFKKEDNKFVIFSSIYLILSVLFLLFLPIFEYSYALPFSFLLYFYLYIAAKKILGVIFYRVLTFSIILFSTLILVYYSGVARSSNIEIYGNREQVRNIKQIFKTYKPTENVFYAHKSLLHHIEDYYWNKDLKPYCSTSVTINKCKQIQNIDKYENIIIISKNKSDGKKRMTKKEIIDFEKKNRIRYVQNVEKKSFAIYIFK